MLPDRFRPDPLVGYVGFKQNDGNLVVEFKKILL